MKGYVLVDKNKAEWRNDLPEPLIGPYDCVIRPAIVAPCTTDIHLMETMANKNIKGKAMGHELAGYIHEIGSEVKDFKPGDRVVVSSTHPNWRGLAAQEGNAGAQDNSHYKTPDLRRGGAFAEFVHILDADMTVAHIPDSVTWEQAVILTDMATTAFAGVEALEMKFGDTVVVYGIGPVGLMGVCAALLNGAGRVYGVGSRQCCFDVAKEFGLTDCINYREGDVADQILSKNGKPVDRVLIAGGTSDAIANSMRMLKFGGVVANVAAFFSDPNTVIPGSVWLYGATTKTVKGVAAKGGRAYMERLINLVQYGRLKPENIITHTFHGFEKIEEAMNIMAKHDPSVIKPIVLYE
jgi:threonine dehydrogenase-like Zn-dependent dehydrogenase